MKWDKVDITDKIYYLSKLMSNTTDGIFDSQDFQIVRAIITGSMNPLSDDSDYGFSMEQHHMDFMRDLWDKAIDNQKDNSIVIKIKNKLK